MRTVKNYVGIILCACVIIFIYKTFDISLFSNILSAFIPLIVGAILAYFLQPLVYKFEMFLDSFQNKKLIKYSHTISSIFVFVVFVLIIVVLMIAIIPALVNYVVNIADNLTLYIKNFEKTLETYLGSNLASEVIIKIDEMVVKYVNSIEAIDPIATLGTLFKAGSTIITAVLGLIFTPYVLIEAKKLVSIFDRLCSLFMSSNLWTIYLWKILRFINYWNYRIYWTRYFKSKILPNSCCLYFDYEYDSLLWTIYRWVSCCSCSLDDRRFIPCFSSLSFCLCFTTI